MKYHIYIDGASSGNPGESGAGIVIFDDMGNPVIKKGIYLGKMTNNMAEYEALCHALQMADEMAFNNIHVYTDSLLLANQIGGKYKVKNSTLKGYIKTAKGFIDNLIGFELTYIPREENGLADRLARDAIRHKGQAGNRRIKPEESPGIKGQDGP